MDLPTREQIAEHAELAAGGETGWSVTHDPEGWFARVTEGRQAMADAAIRRWIATPPERRAARRPAAYSACEDLASYIAVWASGDARPLPWANRVDAGNAWLPGENLIRIKRRAPWCVTTWRPGIAWAAQLGDAVQVDGRYGPHTMILTRLRTVDGSVVGVDVAEYGQHHDADGPGPASASASCRVRRRAVVQRGRDGRWMVDGAPVICSVDLLLLARRSREDALGRADTPPAPLDPWDVGEGARGDVVRRVQAAVGATVDGIWGPRTTAAVRAWQAAQGLPVTGRVGRPEWERIP